MNFFVKVPGEILAAKLPNFNDLDANLMSIAKRHWLVV